MNLGPQDLHLTFRKVLDRAEFFNMLHKVDEEFDAQICAINLNA